MFGTPITPEVPGARAGRFTTSDGTDISYLEAGSGPDMLLVHGWSQSAAQWRKQIEDFGRDHHVVAIDLRGHGDSAKPSTGYRIARLTTDLHELVTALDLQQIRWVGHSMGCAVTWCYWELYGGTRIASIVLVDQSVTLLADPAWTPEQVSSSGAIFDLTTLSDLRAGLAGDDAKTLTEQLIASMFTADVPADDLAWAVERNLALPRPIAGELLVNHSCQDWRDVLPSINVPTLVIGGAASILPVPAIEWVASQIPGAKLRIFGKDERGSHFMFWENPSVFNDVVREFVV